MFFFINVKISCLGAFILSSFLCERKPSCPKFLSSAKNQDHTILRVFLVNGLKIKTHLRLAKICILIKWQ